MRTLRDSLIAGGLYGVLVTATVWAANFVQYETLNARRHGLVYAFPISVFSDRGHMRLPLSIWLLGVVLSLPLNAAFVCGIVWPLKAKCSSGGRTAGVLPWSVCFACAVGLMIYNHLCLIGITVE